MKALNLLLVLLIVKISFSQILPFTFQGVKDYSDHTRIAYFNIEGFKNVDEIYFVKKELLKNIDVYRLEIYKSEGSINNCMIEITENYDEHGIQQLINDKIQESDQLKKKHEENIWEYYRIIYDIPDDCPVFQYYPITNENKEEFLVKIKEWITSNPQKYQEIKHLKEKLNMPE